MLRTKIIAVITFLILTGNLFAETYLVPQPYHTIQNAIDACADGDSVLVSDGWYTGDGNKNIDLCGKAITVLSENGPQSCIIDLQGEGRGFLLENDETRATVIDGFTITDGLMEYGTGFFLDEASPTIRNCVISDCNAYGDNARSAAIEISYCAPLIENCVMEFDSVFTTDNDIGGGAVFAQTSSPEFYNCTFSFNYAEGDGGAIRMDNCLAIMDNCIVKANSINGPSHLYGAGCFFDNTTVTIHNCIITGNYFDDHDSFAFGGGLYFRDSTPTITECEISENSIPLEDYYHGNGAGIHVYDSQAIIDKCLIRDNWIGANWCDGAGICFDHDETTALVTNCTFVNNILLGGANDGSAINIYDCSPVIKNCIIANNTGGEAVHFLIAQNAVLEYNTFYGNDSTAFGGAIPNNLGEILTVNANLDSCDRFSNIFLDPMFVDPAVNNYELQWGSPCIDAGDPESPFDPDGSLADLGAFYYHQNNPITVEGYCFLDGQTNHSGVLVEFQAVYGMAQTDTAYTDSSGYFSRNIFTGTYNVWYTYSEFMPDIHSMVSMGFSTTLNPVTLFTGQLLEGELSGILEAGTYGILDTIRVVEDSTLNVQPGVKFLFNQPVPFIIDGWLNAQGTEADSIIFTSNDLEDGWPGIWFDNEDLTAGSSLSYCTLERGKKTGTPPYDRGGVISCSAGHLFIDNCTIRSSQASYGGGIAAGRADSVSITDCVVIDNAAMASGGGIYCNDTDLLIEDCDITGNSSAESGGGIYLQGDGNMEIIGTAISECNSDYGGGCYSGYGSTPNFSFCDIVSNSAENSGGGVYLHTSDAEIYQSTIEGNHSGSYGGGIFSEGSVIQMDSCEFVNNDSQQGGGFFCMTESNAEISNSVFAENQTSVNGGAVYNAGTINLSRCLLANNRVAGAGGGIYSMNWMTLNNCDFYENSSIMQVSDIYVSGNITNFFTVISNSIFYNTSGDTIIRFLDSDFTNLQYCDFNENYPEMFSGSVPADIRLISNINTNGDSCDVYNNIFLDPMFVDPENGDFHLTENSPCIDAGDPQSPWDPDSTTADIGAYYFDQILEVEPPNAQFLILNYQLGEAYPNPFNSTVCFSYAVPSPGQIELALYDIMGRAVETLFDGYKTPGYYNLEYNPASLASGIYFLRMSAENFTKTQKVVYLK